jgi:ketosteroid isomerase-like protein
VNPPPSPEAVQELLDKQALAEVVMRYCRGVDRADEELILSCFHPDAVDEHGAYRGGPRGFARWIVERMRTWCFVQHRVSNLLFDVRGDMAYGETYSAMEGQLANGTRISGLGRYIDRFERRGGEWRISHRQVVTEWVTPAAGVSVSDFAEGRRDRGDPSYRR